MISTRLKQFLDENEVGYDVMHHDPAFTAQQLAARLHVPGHEFTKVVVVKLDGSYALVALPAPLRVNFKALAHGVGVKKCQLASEGEFQQLFPDCEVGAMPPFGVLYHLPTYVDQELTANENIVINAGTHAEAIRLRYADFARLARPRVVRFGEPPPEEVAAKKKAAAAPTKKAVKPKPAKKTKPKAKAKARQKARGKKTARRKAASRKKAASKRKRSRRR